MQSHSMPEGALDECAKNYSVYDLLHDILQEQSIGRAYPGTKNVRPKGSLAIIEKGRKFNDELYSIFETTKTWVNYKSNRKDSNRNFEHEGAVFVIHLEPLAQDKIAPLKDFFDKMDHTIRDEYRLTRPRQEKMEHTVSIDEPFVEGAFPAEVARLENPQAEIRISKAMSYAGKGGGMTQAVDILMTPDYYNLMHSYIMGPRRDWTHRVFARPEMRGWNERDR